MNITEECIKIDIEQLIKRRNKLLERIESNKSVVKRIESKLKIKNAN